MQKSYLLTLWTVLFSIVLQAQISEGQFTTGDHPKSNILEILGNGNTRAITFSPSAGYLLSDKFMIGAQFSAFHVEENNVNFTQWSLAPFARYYLPGNFFLTAGLGVGNQRRDIGQLGFQDRITFYNLFAGVGKDFFLRPDVALEGIFAYQYSDFSGEFITGNQQMSSLFLDFNLQPFFGGGLGLEVVEPLATGTLFLDLQARLQWQGQTGSDGFFTIDLAPQFGYFFTDRVVVGSEVSIRTFSGGSNTEFGFWLAPFARYYFPPLADRLYAFGALSLGFEKEPGAENAFWSGYLGPGLDYFITPNVALEGQLAYTFLKFKGVPALERALISVGVQFFLRR